MMAQRPFFNSVVFNALTILTAMVSIQMGASLAKQLFPVLNPQGVTALRTGFSALILCAVWRPWRRRISRTELLTIIGYGLSLGIMNLLFYISIERIPLGIAVACEFSGPLTVAFLASRRPFDFVWAILALTGILLILPMSQTSQTLDPVGVLYALGAGVCWALYIVFGQKSGAKTHAGVVSSLGMLMAALATFPVGLVVKGWELFDPRYLPLALAVAILSSAIPYSLEMLALKRLTAKNFGILMSLEPAMAAVSGFLFLGEVLSATQLIAIGCIIAASAGSSMGVKGKAKAEIPT